MVAQAYIPEDTFIVCSYAIGLTPRKINRNPTPSGKRFITVNVSKKKLYMTIDDKKLNDCFNCKSITKKFGGFTALVAGFALGAAIFLTGGTVLLVIAVVAVAATVAVPLIATVVSHACDATLEPTSLWNDFHRTVKIEKNNALLNKSSLTCNIGGVLQLIPDEAAASNAMKQIFWRNMGETALHTGVQFGVGFLNGRFIGKDGAINSLIAGVVTAGVAFYNFNASTSTIVEDAVQEGKSYGENTSIATPVSVTVGKTMENIFYKNSAITDSVVDILVSIEKWSPAVAYKVLNSMQKAIPEQLGKDFTESVGGSVKSGVFIAALTVGLDILSNIAQRSIEGNTKGKLAALDKAEENSSAFNVIATNASN
ncbi:MAG: PAAR-like protein [Acinetobacter sp.]